MTDLEWLPDEPSTSMTIRAPRKCARHEWVTEAFGRPDDEFPFCVRCGTKRDPGTQRRNRRNKANGRNTTRDLADYLGLRNVELLGLPWDAESPALRLQSKRDLAGMAGGRALTLIGAIPAGDYLRGAFHVAPRARLTSGVVWLLLQEWVGTYGWALPKGARLVIAGTTALLALGLPEFADVYGRGEK